jgi:putative membrane protein
MLIKVGVRLVVFSGVFWLAAWQLEKVVFAKRWAAPLVALTFAVLNTALYWLLKSILNIATLGVLGFALPLVINAALIGVTIRIFQSRKWFRVDGFFTLMWMALILTLAHGALWFALDYLPPKL